ncbi:hypothetical protein J6590_005209 [Homalodisca vitripennis]|nr:hypothetical protein J6590_005209 [Homalodisca vitripennis]
MTPHVFVTAQSRKSARHVTVRVYGRWIASPCGCRQQLLINTWMVIINGLY